MRAPIQRYAKVGIIHFMAYPSTIRGEGPILETLEKIARDDYFDAIEITWIKDENTRRAARDLLRSSGMAIGFGSQPPLLIGKLDVNSEDETERKKAVDAVKASIDEAIFMGASGVALLSGKDPGPEKRAKAMDLLVDSLKQLCAYSRAKNGPWVILETFDRVEFGKNCLTGPTAESVEVARRVRAEYPEFGLMLDLSHLPLLDETAEEALTTAKNCLVHVHIGNCMMKDPNHPAYGDEHPRFGIEGGENGVPELTEFLSALFDIGYLDPYDRRMMSFEVKPLPGESPEVVIANAKRTLNEAWARV